MLGRKTQWVETDRSKIPSEDLVVFNEVQCGVCGEWHSIDAESASHWTNKYFECADVGCSCVINSLSRGDTLDVAPICATQALYDREPHEVLGVSPNADLMEIKRRYIALARATHPDKAGGHAAMFRQVRWAYEEIVKRSGAPAMSCRFVQVLLRMRSKQHKRYVWKDVKRVRYWRKQKMQLLDRPVFFINSRELNLRAELLGLRHGETLRIQRSICKDEIVCEAIHQAFTRAVRAERGAQPW